MIAPAAQLGRTYGYLPRSFSHLYLYILPENQDQGILFDPMLFYHESSLQCFHFRYQVDQRNQGLFAHFQRLSLTVLL